ncbi:hypothetical protein FKM82_018825 [Ascaphus truei]
MIMVDKKIGVDLKEKKAMLLMAKIPLENIKVDNTRKKRDNSHHIEGERGQKEQPKENRKSYKSYPKKTQDKQYRHYNKRRDSSNNNP